MDKELDNGQGTGSWTRKCIMDKELDHGQLDNGQGTE